MRTALEISTKAAYSPNMNKIVPQAPLGWREILDESQAELEAGLAVPSEIVMNDLKDSLARMKAKRAQQQPTRRTAQKH